MAKGRCRFCGAVLNHTFVDLGMSPLCESYVAADSLNAMEAFYPLRVYVCDVCFLVQLEEYVNPKDIFSEYAYFSSYSDLWLAHARAFAGRMTEELRLDGDSLVIEVGSNDGYLLQYFVELGIPVLGVEPAANVAEVARRNGVPTVVRFFGERTGEELAEQGKRASLLVGNNVLAQVPDVNDFVRGMKAALGSGGVITMEFPHLVKLMEGNQFDTIYHEHFSYFSLLSVEKIFAAHGLTIFHVEELPTHGGSLRIFARHAEDESQAVRESVPALRAAEEGYGLKRLDRYESFSNKVRETKWKLLEFLISAKRAGATIVGYGAPGKGNTLLNYCGIRTDFIDYTVDRNPYKQGKFLPGTHIPICHPDRIRETRPDYILILPWNLKDEIINQLTYVRQWGGRFVVPIPEVTVFP